ncbi:hypothetical protein B0H11DRAFT_2147084 [Mycena galericulata]|nr:hypothetical protein B0H11DRAFT_2147084 [Mycena galericulata]
MSAGSTARDPYFPVDLEREIFETVALMYPREIPTLLRVARRVLVWIEPFLYKVICSNSSSVLNAMKSKSPAFLQNSVRHLFLDYTSTWSPEQAADALKLCSGVINFAVIGRFSNPTLLPILADMHVQRLAVCLQNLFGGYPHIDLRHQLFTSITHIDIFDCVTDVGESYICSHIPALPALTHLCLNEAPWSVVEKMLTDCAKLEVLVLLWPSTSSSKAFEWMDESPFRDVRLVAALYKDYWEDWENGARGHGNFWSAADTLVACKRRGEIDGARLWLEGYLFGLNPNDDTNLF